MSNIQELSDEQLFSIAGVQPKQPKLEEMSDDDLMSIAQIPVKPSERGSDFQRPEEESQNAIPTALSIPKNIASDALEVAKGIGSMVAHPIDTVKGAAGLVSGAVENVASELYGNVPLSERSPNAKMAMDAGETLANHIVDPSKPVTLGNIASTVANTAYEHPVSTLSSITPMKFNPAVKMTEAALKTPKALTIGAKLASEKFKVPEKIINSLIKPLQKDFSYGKDPGRAVASEGITANNFEDLASNISKKKNEIGETLGNQFKELEGKETLDLNNALSPIDEAMKEAAVQNNQTLLNRLQEVKKSLTDNLINDVDKNGNQIIVSTGSKNLSSAPFSEGLKFKQQIGKMTKWTGNASDDKAVNLALKKSYGLAKQEIVSKAGKINPDIAKKIENLSEKYADLTSAELATIYRDKINMRQNLVQMPYKVGATVAIGTALATGGTSIIPSILVGIGAQALEKALSSTAVKTRFAKWLSNEKPTVINDVIKANPSIKPVISGLLPSRPHVIEMPNAIPVGKGSPNYQNALTREMDTLPEEVVPVKEPQKTGFTVYDHHKNVPAERKLMTVSEWRAKQRFQTKGKPYTPKEEERIIDAEFVEHDNKTLPKINKLQIEAPKPVIKMEENRAVKTGFRQSPWKMTKEEFLNSYTLNEFVADMGIKSKQAVSKMKDPTAFKNKILGEIYDESVKKAKAEGKYIKPKDKNTFNGAVEQRSAAFSRKQPKTMKQKLIDAKSEKIEVTPKTIKQLHEEWKKRKTA